MDKGVWGWTLSPSLVLTDHDQAGICSLMLLLHFQGRASLCCTLGWKLDCHVGLHRATAMLNGKRTTQVRSQFSSSGILLRFSEHFRGTGAWLPQTRHRAGERNEPLALCQIPDAPGGENSHR